MKTTYFKIIIIIILCSPVLTYAQSYYNSQLRKKIVEKRLKLSTEYENQNFNVIPYNYTIQSFYVLSSIEQELLALIQEKFENFKGDYLANSQFTYIRHNYRWQYRTTDENRDLKKFRYSSSAGNNDRISFHLRSYLVNNKDFYIDLVRQTDLPLFEQDFIVFFIEQLEYTFRWGSSTNSSNEEQLRIAEKGKSYVENHPKSPYNKFVRSYHGNFHEPGWFAMDLNLGVGSGGFTGEMGEILSRMWGFELDLKYYLHSTFIGTKANVTFNKSKASAYIKDHYLVENRKGLWLGFFDLYIGRRFDMFEVLSILPHYGYSLSEFSIYWGDDNWSTYYEWAPAYGLDINLAPVFKQRTHFSRFKRNLYQTMAYFRLNIMINETGLEEIDPVLDGRSVQVNLGVGVHFRATKRTKLF